jgi:hypothetical protein
MRAFALMANAIVVYMGASTHTELVFMGYDIVNTCLLKTITVKCCIIICSYEWWLSRLNYQGTH